MTKNLLIIAGGLILIGFVWTGWKAFEATHPGGFSIPCTQEAKICPDGSSVGRVAPACNFADCPAATTTPETPGVSGVQGKVLYGPTCPVMREPPDPQCADRPYSTDLVLVTASGQSVQSFRSGVDGSFTLTVPPGTYVIRGAAGKVPPRCSSDTFDVLRGAYTSVSVQCDSGIR